MNSLLDQSVIIKSPIRSGDCGVILRKEGGFEIFSVDITDPDALTPQQLENGTLLTAIAICLKYPDLKDTLLRLASDPQIVGDAPFKVTNPN
jgi:hypothetical protein